MVSLPDPFNAAAYFVDRNVRAGGGRSVAFECGDESVTYGQLLERVNRVGSALRDQLGVRPEERVLLLLTDSPAFAYAFFGAVKIGAVPVPLNTLWKTPDYKHVLEDAGAQVLIVSESLLPQILALGAGERAGLHHIVVVGQPPAGLLSFDELLTCGSPDLEAHRTRQDSMAVWLYSSGSTGRPKACVHLHRDMVVTTEAFGKGVLGISETDRFFSASRLFFAYGLGNALYMPLAVGGTAILSPAAPNAAGVFALVERHRPTLFYWVPTGYAMLLAHHREAGADFDFSSVRCALSAGEALPPTLFARFKQRFGVEILDGIGATETMHNFISNRPGAARAGSTGVLVPGYEARLLDEARRPVPAGEIGTLEIKGDSICAGYWNQPEKTQRTFEGQWFRTGDRFSRDADGYYWFAGRADDMLKVGGMWVSPVEVEQVVLQHPAVHECAVAGREDGDRLVKPCAFVVTAGHASPDAQLAADLQTFVSERLAGYKRPRWIEFVPDLPKTPTGKIQRFKLR